MAAMGRTKWVCALTETTVVVASDRDTGGIWTGAVEALRPIEHASWSIRCNGYTIDFPEQLTLS
jgi:hypothetical protein